MIVWSSRLAGVSAMRRCTSRFITPLSLHRRPLVSFSHLPPFNTTRFYSSEQKKNPESDGKTEPQVEKNASETNTTGKVEKEAEKNNTNEKVENTETKTEQKTEQQTEQKTDEQKTEEKTEQKADQKTEGKTEDNTNKTEGGGQQREELPPWFASLPVWKKILYPSLLISFVSLMTELIYQSTLRSALPYKRAMHVIRSVDEVEQAMGEIKEPRWFRFWEMLYGYTWEESGGYEGVAKFWIPIVGVTEHQTGEIDKKGQPVVYKTYTRGRAYAEARKAGAGPLEWDLVYLVVKSPLLDNVLNNNGNNASGEWLDVNREGRTLPFPPTKGEMVIINKQVTFGSEF